MKRGLRFGVLFSVVICLFSSYLYSLDPRLLFDTYNSVAQNKSHLSPIHGAVLSETGVLKNYYDLGMREDPQIKLVRNIFVKALGNFVISRVESRIGAHLSPNLIGKIVGAIEAEMTGEANFERLRNSIKELIIQDEFFQDSIGKAKEKFNKVLEELKVAKAQLKEEEKNILVKFLEQYKGYSLKKGLGFVKSKIRNNLQRKNIKPNIKQDLQNQQELIEKLEKEHTQTIKNNIEEIGKRKSDLNFRAERVEEFVSDLVDCFNGNENYSPYFGHMVLQAFLYEKSESKEDLWEYFQGIESQLPDEVLNAEKETWIASKYEKDSEEIARENTEFYENLGNIENNFEEIAIVKILYDYYLGALPTIVEYKQAAFEGIEFSDCMESALRNLVQIIMFSNGEFVVREGMDEVYAKLFEGMTSTNTSDIKFHQKWSNLIQNKKYLVYHCIKNKDENDLRFASILQGTEGFIFLDNRERAYLEQSNLLNEDTVSLFIGEENYTFETFNIGDSKYVLVDPNKFSLFEIMPSIRNTITLLCDLFNINILELTESEEEHGFISEFVKGTFNSVYFPVLCRMFGLIMQSPDERSVDELDSEDEKNISIYLKKGKGEFELKFFPRFHGEIHDHSKIENWGLAQNIFKVYRRERADIFWSLLSLSKLTSRKYRKFFRASKHIEQRDFFVLSMKLTRNKIDILKKYFSRRSYFYNELNEEIIDNLIGSLPVNIEVMESLQDLVSKYHKAFLYERVILFAKRGMSSLDTSLVSEALDLFGELVKKDQAFNLAIEAAKEGVSRENIAVKTSALELFIELVKKGWGFDEATEVAKKNIYSDSENVRNYVLMLSGELVEKGIVFDEALEAAKMGLANNDGSIRKSALNLSAKLVEKGIVFDEALEAAKMGLANNDRSTRKSALNLSAKLVEKGIVFDEALEAAKRGLISSNRTTKNSAFRLFEELFKKGFGFEGAIEAAREYLGSNKGSVSRDAGLELVNLLKKHSDKMSQEALNDFNFLVSRFGLDLGSNSESWGSY